MKALVISDDNLKIKAINECLKKYNSDSINYKWLLKALDNIEEISPDITIINVQDYPRHWKVLAQFLNSGIAENQCKTLLFSDEPFSIEEENKAKALGIYGVFSNIMDDESEKSLSFYLSKITGKTFCNKNTEIKNEQKINEKINSHQFENTILPCVDDILFNYVPSISKKNESENESETKTISDTNKSDFLNNESEDKIVKNEALLTQEIQEEKIEETYKPDSNCCEKENLEIPTVESIISSFYKNEDVLLPTVDSILSFTCNEKKDSKNDEDCKKLKNCSKKEGFEDDKKASTSEKQKKRFHGHLIQGKSLLLKIQSLYEKE